MSSVRRAPGTPRQTYSMVNGVTDREGMPRIGKLRLGEKGTSTGGKEYPKELDYFRVDPDKGLMPDQQKIIREKFLTVYGERPAVLHQAFFPSNDQTFVFPNALESWKRGQNGSKLWCHGDGVRASRIDWETGVWTDRDCCHVLECPVMQKGDCKLISRLRILLPLITLSGYWQVDTGSQASTGNIIDVINQLQRIFGRLMSIPLVLSREAQAMTFEGKSNTHYILHLRAPNVDLQELRELVGRNQFALPAAPADLQLDDEDLPDDLIPSSVQVPEPEPALRRRIEQGFDILNTKPADRLVAWTKFKDDPAALLRDVSSSIDKMNAGGPA